MKNQQVKIVFSGAAQEVHGFLFNFDGKTRADPALPDMDFSYITENTGLKNCLNHLIDCKEIAIDLEFDKNRNAYGFNLCLLQLYSGSQCFLIDPLGKDIDLKMLFPILENKQVQKLVFAFGEDLRLLHTLGCFPKNLFDLAIAARLLNYPPGSLAALLETVLAITVSKSSQNSNWLKRPLTEKQLEYAALDVVHLPELKSVLVKEAQEKNLLAWIEEENAAFDKLSYAGVENNVVLKKQDKNGMTEFEWQLYKNLVALREEIAVATGRPSHHIAGKEVLREMAQHPGNESIWKNSNSKYTPLLSARYSNRLWKILRATEEEAEELKLSKTEPANKPLSREESQQLHRERKRVEEIKKTCFKPIQKEIANDYGEHAVTMILGNRAIAAIISGELSQLKDYQLKLVGAYAQKLNIDLSPFFHQHPVRSN